MSRYVGGPILRYGGKVKLAPRIVPRLPRARLYIETHFGGGGLFFAIPGGTYPGEIVNDIDHDVVNFFQQLRAQPAELRRLLEATPHSREEFRLALLPTSDPLERARRFFVLSRQSFAGVGRHWSRLQPDDPLPFRPYAADRAIDSLEAFADRLRHVAIECSDAVALVTRYARPNVAMYVDPPYLPSTRKTHGGDAYKHETDEAGHEALLAGCVLAAEGGAHVAISGYPSAMYDTALRGWRCERMLTRAGHRGVIGPRTECLWMSYPPDVEIASVSQHALDLEARP